MALLAGLATSCASFQQTATAPRFYEGAAADVVVRFYAWDSINIMRPDVRENGFLPLLDRDGAVRKLERPDIGRGLAVVVLGNLLTSAQESELIRDWDALLIERGFRRVVLLRAGSKDKINGLLVVHDSAMAAANDERTRVAETFAAVTSPAGADVAHPSGYSIR
jgi:hypothetical protein